MPWPPQDVGPHLITKDPQNVLELALAGERFSSSSPLCFARTVANGMRRLPELLVPNRQFRTDFFSRQRSWLHRVEVERRGADSRWVLAREGAPATTRAQH